MRDLQRYAPMETFEGTRMIPDPYGEFVRHDDAVKAIGLEANRAELLAEDIACLHLCLDKAGVPRADDAGAVYSLWGRVMRLKPEQLKPE